MLGKYQNYHERKPPILEWQLVFNFHILK